DQHIPGGEAAEQIHGNTLIHPCPAERNRTQRFVVGGRSRFSTGLQPVELRSTGRKGRRDANWGEDWRFGAEPARRSKPVKSSGQADFADWRRGCGAREPSLVA